MEFRNGFKIATNYISAALSIEDGLKKGDALYTSGLFNCIAIVAYNAVATGRDVRPASRGCRRRPCCTSGGDGPAWCRGNAGRRSGPRTS
jgi:hypothetical protein